MFDLKKLETYSIPQAIAAIVFNLVIVSTIAVGITIKKYYGFGIEVILITTILTYAKIFYEGEGRFDAYAYGRQYESRYFQGNKAKIISLLLVFALAFLCLMLSPLNKDFFESLLLNNFLAAALSFLLFFPFLKYKDEVELNTIHSIKNTYLSRSEAWLYKVLFFILSLIIGVYISSILTGFITSNQKLRGILFLSFPIIWVLITAWPINRLTKAD